MNSGAIVLKAKQGVMEDNATSPVHFAPVRLTPVRALEKINSSGIQCKGKVGLKSSDVVLENGMSDGWMDGWMDGWVGGWVGG